MPADPAINLAAAATPPLLLLLDVAAVCEALKIGRTKLHEMRRAGLFPLKAIPLGGRAVRYSVDELKRWVAAGCPAADRWRMLQQAPMRRTG